MPVAERGRPPPPGVAASRAINRNPLTPKVAAKGSPVGSPMTRKPQGPPPMLAGANRDDTNSNNNSPAPYLASNITPRSGSRQIRAETFHGTPTPAPTTTSDRTSDGWDSNNNSRLGLGLTVASADMASSRPTSMLADSSTDSPDSKFFYASDARNVQQQQPVNAQQRPTSSQKPATFFYANGTVEPTRRTSPPSNTTPIANMPPLTTDSSVSKFFYANGQPDGPVKQPAPISSSTSTLSTTPRPAPTSRPTSAYSVTAGPGLFPRPTSPIKQLGSPGQGFRTAMSPVSPNRVQATSPPGFAASDLGLGKGKRRVSIETAPPLLRHQSQPEAQTTEIPPLPRLTLSPNPLEQISPPLSPDPLQASLTMASILRAAEALEEKESEPSGVQSPTKSTFSDAAIQDLVVNARRERKVQDLEITNASLEAINRTLERQLRKQTSELRRFRRLSRSGRLSLNSIPNSRNVSAALTDPAVNLSDLSEHEDSEEEEEDDDSMDDSFNSPPDSPSGLVESPAALRRKRDERRLQLDLTKHQEILVDSQKMNQSIKRCLNWTDLLIKEGQKALAYKVNVSDIKFGGRILTPLDEEEDALQDHDPSPPASEHSLEPPRLKAAQYRDSGIELQAAEGP